MAEAMSPQARRNLSNIKLLNQLCKQIRRDLKLAQNIAIDLNDTITSVEHQCLNLEMTSNRLLRDSIIATIDETESGYDEVD